MMNPSQSAEDKVLTPRASSEMLGRNIATLVDKGIHIEHVLKTLAEYLADADDQSIGEANRYLYRWIAGE